MLVGFLGVGEIAGVNAFWALTHLGFNALKIVRHFGVEAPKTI